MWENVGKKLVEITSKELYWHLVSSEGSVYALSVSDLLTRHCKSCWHR